MGVLLDRPLADTQHARGLGHRKIEEKPQHQDASLSSGQPSHRAANRSPSGLIRSDLGR